MRTGVIKFYTKHGFGFITPNDGSPDVFYHFTAVDRRQHLNKGDRVQFTAEMNDRGERATQVIPV